VTSATVRAADKSPTSARTIARSTFPAEKASDASSSVPVSAILRRIRAPLFVSWLAVADIRRTASPSNDPAAIVMVFGAVKCR
jgi:hypothetical protein